MLFANENPKFPLTPHIIAPFLANNPSFYPIPAHFLKKQEKKERKAGKFA